MTGPVSTNNVNVSPNHAVAQDIGIPRGGDIHSFIQHVLRESYLEMLEDLAYYAAKVKQFNAMKDAIRERLTDYRDVLSKLAGLDSDAPLNGTPNTAGGPTPPANPDASQVIITSSDQRREEYPDENVMVAEFLGYSSGSGRTDLEDLLIRDPGARNRFVQAVPFMTSEELAQALSALGGSDMKLHGSLDGLYSQIIEAMTPHQVLELGAMTEGATRYDIFGRTYYSNPLRDDDFFNLFRGRLNRERATAETKLGVSGKSTQELADLWKAEVQEAAEIAAAAQRAAEEEAAAAEAEAQADNNSDDEPVFETALDLDHTDGSIDNSIVVEEEPYVVKGGEPITTKAELEAAIQGLEEKLASVGDDAQLANVDLQNALQKQQHLIQLMSNISKMMHDTNMAIIRKISG